MKGSMRNWKKNQYEVRMAEYENILKEKNQDKRIDIILTDAYDEYEQQSAICCYLEDYMKFPFKAKIRGEKSKIFTVLRFTSVEPHRVVCKIDLGGNKIRVPLTEIEPLDKRSTNSRILGDFLKFLEDFA